MGTLYRDGLGVEKDISTAVEFYKEAEAGGDEKAKKYLGETYWNEGVTEQAHFWLKQSAIDGDKEGQELFSDLIIELDERANLEDVYSAILYLKELSKEGYGKYVLELSKLENILVERNGSQLGPKKVYECASIIDRPSLTEAVELTLACTGTVEVIEIVNKSYFKVEYDGIEGYIHAMWVK